MYAEQAHCHLADANFYFSKGYTYLRSRAEGAPLGRQMIGDAPCACEATLRTHLDTKTLVELSGIEPLTPCLQSRCSPS